MGKELRSNRLAELVMHKIDNKGNYAVWYLVKEKDDGTACYHVGSAIEILGEYLDCRVTTGCTSYNRLGMKSMSTGGTVEDIFKEAWNERTQGYLLKLDEKDFLSPKQQELWDKVREYAKANPEW